MGAPVHNRVVRSVVWVAVLVGVVGASHVARADDAGAAAPVVVPYDSPAPPEAAPPTPPVAPPPARARQIEEDETPVRPTVEPLRLRPPMSTPLPRPRSGTDAGIVVGQVLVGYLTSVVAGSIALVAVFVGGGGGAVFVLAAPVATGGVVCGIGSFSDMNTGSCSSALAGAYLGALLAIPTALLTARQSGSSYADVLFGGFAGYILGMTIGSVIAWNVTKEPKKEPLARAAAVDPAIVAEGAAERAAWSEPLRRRGAADAAARVVVPVLAFAF
jgi:hypothetical protein